MKATAVILLCAAALGPGCAFLCPKCPVDTLDGVGVSLPVTPRSAVRGAVYSVFALVAAEAGPESPEMQALDAALAGSGLRVGRFFAAKETPGVRGYALFPDGRLVLDERYVLVAPPTAEFLKDARVWSLIPFLYAAGHRLARGGTWESSVDAAAEFAGRLAASLRGGRHREHLPAGTDVPSLVGYLDFWRSRN